MSILSSTKTPVVAAPVLLLVAILLGPLIQKSHAGFALRGLIRTSHAVCSSLGPVPENPTRGQAFQDFDKAVLRKLFRNC